MTESLVVDPARLKAAGVALRDQVLPAPPPPMAATGTDSMSAAINETLPIIESPVVDGLPDAQTALINTGSKIATAADMYAETDQLLGEHVGAVQFLTARDQSATGAVSALLGAETADKTGGATAGRPAQLSAMTQATQPVTQALQTVTSSVQQATGGMGSAGAAPAKPADDTNPEDTKEPDEKQAAPTGLEL